MAGVLNNKQIYRKDRSVYVGLNNTIFLMYLVTQNYCREHRISVEDFLKLDEKYAILNYVAECPDIFDSLTGSEMVREVEQYVAQP